MDDFWSIIRTMLTENFNETELQNLIFDEDIDSSGLNHSNTQDLAREILLYVKRKFNQEKQIEFLEALKKERPDHDWPDWPVEKQPTKEAQPKQISIPKTLSAGPSTENRPAKTKIASKQIYAWAVGLAGLTAIIIVIVMVASGPDKSVEANESNLLPVTEASIPASTSIEPTLVVPSITNDLSPTETVESLAPMEVLESTEAPVEISASESSIPSESDNGSYQVRTLNTIQLFREPKDGSDVIRGVESDSTLTVFRKDTPNNYKWLYAETESGIEGWIKINNRILEKLSDFNYDDLPSRYDVVESSSSSDVLNQTSLTNKSEVNSKSSSSCTSQVRFEYSLDSDHKIIWSNLPDEAGSLILNVNRISPAEGDSIPLVEQNRLDSGAIQQGVFHVPRTRFSERGYEKGDTFQITLVVQDSNGAEICPESVNTVFTWDGRQ